MIKRILLGTAAFILGVGTLPAQVGTVTLLNVDEGLFPNTVAGGYNDFMQTDDSDPNGVVRLSSGSFVWFESEATAAPGGTPGGGPGDFLVLFDPDAVGGGLNRYSVFASKADMNTLFSTSFLDIKCGELARSANDDVFAVFSGNDSDPEPYYIVKFPNTGVDTWGPAVLMADAADLPSNNAGEQLTIAYDDATDRLYFTFDAEGGTGADDTTSGFFWLDGDADAIAMTDDTINQIVGTTETPTHATFMTAIGGVGGTDKAEIQNIEVLGDGNLVIGHGNADAEDADVAILDVTTGVITELINAVDQPGTPTLGIVSYNASRDSIIVFWEQGLPGSPTDPNEEDRIEEWSTSGTLLNVLANEPMVEAVGSSFTDLAQSGDAMDTDGDFVWFYLSNTDEGLFQIEISNTMSVRDWTLYE